MSDRNTIWVPCQDCKLEGDKYLVEVYVPDEVLDEYDVKRADELFEEDINSLLSDKRISPELTCSTCGSGLRGEENSPINDDDDDFQEIEEKMD